MQIMKNLFQVGGSLNGITYTNKEDASYEDGNTYILKTDYGLIMFDCGCGETLEQIFNNMRYWDLDPYDIKACLITHPHLDHAGAAYMLSRQQVKFYAHKNTVDAVATGDERCCGYLYHKEFIPCILDYRLSDEETINILGVKIKVMHMPGHTMGCTAYIFEHENKVIVISGDIIGTLLDGYFGWSGSIDFNKKLYIETLKRFSKLDSDIMLPGHGMVYFHKPRRRVEEALNQALIQWR
jgi:metallo-beta-lactamase class B